MKKKEDLEKIYTDLESSLPEEEVPESLDSLSSVSCAQCGARLTRDEWQEFEDTCEECIWHETSGIIDDDPEDELE